MLVTFTDFGHNGPYLGQFKAALYRHAPDIPVFDLFVDAPAQRVRESAYLLAVYAQEFPPGSVFVCVVDPGVGSSRQAVVAVADGRTFVGPDNGLFELLRRRATDFKQWRIDYRPQRLSASFHGRDLFAPVAALIAAGRLIPGQSPELSHALVPAPIHAWPDELAVVCYVDHYGNLISGVRASEGLSLAVDGVVVPRQRTFADVAAGQPLCYENSSGLLELAINAGRADEYFGLSVGSELALTHSP